MFNVFEKNQSTIWIFYYGRELLKEISQRNVSLIVFHLNFIVTHK